MSSLRTWMLGLAACLVAACNPQPGDGAGGSIKRLSIATGGTGGVYYPYGGGIAKIISENLKGVEATAEATAASVDNIKFLRDGRSDIAFSMADTAGEAALGQGPFKETGTVPTRALAVLYTNYLHLVTRADTGIAKVADLKGRVGLDRCAWKRNRSRGVPGARGPRPQSEGRSQDAGARRVTIG